MRHTKLTLALAIAAALLIATPVRAAGQTLTQTASAQWHMVEPPATVSTMTFTLYNSNVVSAGNPVAGALTPTCSATAAPGTGTDCAATVPANMQPTVGGNYAVCARFTAGVSLACSSSVPTGPPAPGTPLQLAITIVLKWQ
jgi:hypothetical protein